VKDSGTRSRPLRNVAVVVFALLWSGCDSGQEASDAATNDKVGDAGAAGENQPGDASADGTSPAPDGGGAKTCANPADARPNDGSGCWPDSSNTGYANAPDYPGKLTDFPINQGNYILLDASYNGKTLSFYRFRAKVVLAKSGIDTIHFHGCSFETNLVNDIAVYDWTTSKSTYSYCTFKPSAAAKPPVSCANSYQIAINQSANQAMTVDHSEIWGMGNGVQFGSSSAARPLVFTNNYIHDAADPDNAGGCNYHHDGIGPCSDGGISYVTIEHNTLASTGNTNGIALQGNKPYDHVRIADNYISGWGYAVSIGAGDTAKSNSNTSIEDNVFSGQLTSLYGPYYGNVPLDAGRGNVWKGNRMQVRAGDPWGQAAWNGTYWWPTDDVGHATDYVP
jgi:hypothetical protein